MDFTAPAPLSLSSLALNLCLGILVSLLIAWYYARYGRSLSNRASFAPLLPILTLIVILVISVVKSSLALSLGLVGALSIVRFRTAIKDPEELIFLFLAIGLGLGLGADQQIPTLLAVAIIVGYLFIQQKLKLGWKKSHSMYLNIEVDAEQENEVLFAEINRVLMEHVPEADLRRLDSRQSNLSITYYLSITEQDTVIAIMDALKTQVPGSSLSFVEQNNLLGG